MKKGSLHWYWDFLSPAKMTSLGSSHRECHQHMAFVFPSVFRVVFEELFLIPTLECSRNAESDLDPVISTGGTTTKPGV